MEELVGRDRGTMVLEGWTLEEGCMVQEDRWREIHRLFREEKVPIAEIARRLELDRKTVRSSLTQERWQPYRRERRRDTLLAEYAEYLQERAPQVRYSAQVLFQELRRRGYRGGYDTVKRYVQPLRGAEVLAERASVRFETGPGHQSQVDWGTARVELGRRAVQLHLFVLTLGYSRRGFMAPFLDERLPQFLDAHERAFEHFGGHTREHLYDRPRTICRPDGEGGVVWNPTFRSFADYWGFEPRLCRAYRARTKGKVESGVKYVKRNFLVGRSFVDLDTCGSSGRSGTRPSPICASTARPTSDRSIVLQRSAHTWSRGDLVRAFGWRRASAGSSLRISSSLWGHKSLFGSLHTDRPDGGCGAPGGRGAGASQGPRRRRAS